MIKIGTALLVSATLLGFAPASQAQTAAPCISTVAPVRNKTIVVDIQSASKNMEVGDQNVAMTFVFLRLMDDGKPDGNTFDGSTPPTGKSFDIRLVLTIIAGKNAENSGTLSMSDWGGAGQVRVFNTAHSYTKDQQEQLIEDLTDMAYSFIHNGWRDTRPECQKKSGST